MELALAPDAGEVVRTAIVGALEREGVDLDRKSPAHRSAWRVAGLAEGVERVPSAAVWPCYSALSPRSMRGATRA